MISEKYRLTGQRDRPLPEVKTIKRNKNFQNVSRRVLAEHTVQTSRSDPVTSWSQKVRDARFFIAAQIPLVIVAAADHES